MGRIDSSGENEVMQDLEEMKESKFSDIRHDEDGDALVEMT